MKVMSVYDKRRDNNKKKTNKTTHKSNDSGKSTRWLGQNFAESQAL